MSGYYGVADKDPNNGLDAYVEAADGGWYLYVMNGDKKQYVNMVESGTYRNYKYEDAAATVWDYTDGYFKTTDSKGAEVWAGTRGNFTTIGCYVETSSSASADTASPLHAYAKNP